MALEPVVTIDGRASWPPAGWAGPSDGSAAGRGAHERRQADREAQKAIWDDPPWIFRHYPKLPVVRRPGWWG